MIMTQELCHYFLSLKLMKKKNALKLYNLVEVLRLAEFRTKQINNFPFSLFYFQFTLISPPLLNM